MVAVAELLVVVLVVVAVAAPAVAESPSGASWAAVAGVGRAEEAPAVAPGCLGAEATTQRSPGNHTLGAFLGAALAMDP